MLQFTRLDPRVTSDHLGFIPEFLSEADPRTAVEQIDANYQHGGGWRDAKIGGPNGWRLLGEDMILRFPGDPPLHPYAGAYLHRTEPALPTERVIIYESGWTAVIQLDGSFRLCRLD